MMISAMQHELVLQPDISHHHRDIRATLSEKHDLHRREELAEDEDADRIPEHHLVVRVPTRRASVGVHGQGREAPDNGAKEAAGFVC